MPRLLQEGVLKPRIAAAHRLGEFAHALQRVAIARALLKEPALVLADEPTGELDSNTGNEIFGYLRSLGEAHGTTVVVVTHDQSYITANDRVLTLRDGQVVERFGPQVTPEDMAGVLAENLGD